MAYEIEQFGIKVILIEPGVIKTNFDNNLKIGKRVSITPNSSYSDMTQKRISGFKPRFESGSPPLEVAKVILKAITSENLSELRYIVGIDAFKLMEIRNNTSNKDFVKLVMKSILQFQQC
jgi:NAD(P)-dependent dehydrogenase (short-subunit alcohol dehydrogenase family)